jgi:hypothetical protein
MLKKKSLRHKIVLRLPDLDHARSSVLNTLSSPNARRNYRFAMDQFIAWYYSEPRVALNRAVVLRFRLHLESTVENHNLRDVKSDSLLTDRLSSAPCGV